MMDKNAILDSAKITAINSFYNFLGLLGYEKSAYSHLTKCNIILSNKTCYKISTNEIEIDQTLLDNLIKNNETDKTILILSIIIVQGLLHSNRDLIIEDELNINNINEKIQNDIHKMESISENVNEDELRHLLENKIINEEVDEKELIPLKYILNENGLSVIVYDNFTNLFLKYNNLDFPLTDNPRENDSNFLRAISDESNGSSFSVVPVGKDHYNLETNNTIANNFISSTSNAYKKIIYNSKNDYKDLMNKININKEIIMRRLQANGFEEIITNTLGYIIVYSREDNTFDLDKLIEKINEDFPDNTITKVGLSFIKMMGLEMLNWYITSVYEDIYYDYFEQTFDDSYDELLMNFQKIYESVINDEKPNPFFIKNIENIVRTKKNI